MDLENIKKQFDEIQDMDSLSALYDSYLWKQWVVSLANKELATLSGEEKKARGQQIQADRQYIQELYDQKKWELQTGYYDEIMKKDTVDFSMSYDKQDIGYMHILQKERRKIEEITMSLGYTVFYGSDVVTKYENFHSVNIPSTHPATEMHDTYFLDQLDDWGDNMVLRTQTSAMQNFVLKKFGVPSRIVIPGKVYRNENVDASHDTVFWQLEWVVVDKWLSLANLKDSMQQILTGIFEKEVKLRMRPSFFPFVEPGLEIDAGCPICDQKWCSLCKQTGWIEILGAGMIHPNVLKEADIDPEVYSGFAFGFGINRIVAIKYWVKDIRYFTNGDLRFLQSIGR